MKADELPDQESNPVPDGRYKLGVKEIKKKVGNDSGIGYIEVNYIITDGEHFKRHIYDNVSLSNKSVWMLGRWLKALDLGEIELPIEQGADSEYIVDEEGCFTIISENVIGCEVEADVDTQPANEEKGWKARNNVKFYHKIELAKATKWDE